MSNCDFCKVEFPPKSKRQRFCSDKCRYALRDKNRTVPCAVCEAPMQRSGKTVPGTSNCWECRHGVPKGTVTHGTDNAYRRYHCRCGICRAKQAQQQRAFNRNYKARTGVEYRSLFEDNNRWWINPVRRQAIYVRDGWVCQLCFEPVDRTLDHQIDPMGATLDHIDCQSWTDNPDHSNENLRLAHRSCNSARGNRPDLAVSA